MSTRTSVYARNVMVGALAELAKGGHVCGYGGMRPDSIEGAPGSPPLFRCALSSFVAARKGSIKAKAVAPESDAREGEIAWYRVFSADGRALWDAEGGEWDHTDVQAGAEVLIESLIYTLPE